MKGLSCARPPLRVEVGFVVVKSVLVLVALVALLGFPLALLLTVPPGRRHVDWQSLPAILLAIAVVLGAVTAGVAGGRGVW